MASQSSTARVIHLDDHRARVRRLAAAPADLADDDRPRPVPRVFVAALIVSAALHVVLLVSASLSHHLIHHETVPPKVLEVSLPEPPKPEPAVVPPPKQPPPRRAQRAPRAPVPAAATPPPMPVMAVPETAPAQPVTVAPPAERRPEPPPPPAPAAAPVTAPVFNAAYLRNPPPGYPMTARRLGQQGRVLLEVHVGTDGRADEVKLGKTSGHTALDEAAIAAVRGWTFVPARRGTEPVAAWVEVPVRFRLDGGE